MNVRRNTSSDIFTLEGICMKLNRILAMLIALLLLLAVPALCEGETDWQTVVDEGWTAYKNKDYTTALNLWLTVPTEHMDGLVANNIGWMYDHGEGTAEDDAKALEWFLIGHEKGNETATRNAALMYYNAENYDEAFKFYALCDVEDLSGSDANRIGWMYGTGNGVELDDAKALEWYLIGHEKGNKTATCNVGNKYYAARNYVEAFKYYSLCEIEDLSSYAALALGDMYDNGFGVEPDLDKAIELYNHAHQLGSSKGTIELGYVYYETENYSDAFEVWSTLPEENMTDHIAAQIGWMYMSGSGIDYDPNQAIKWYEIAAAKGNTYAIGRLAWYYYYGIGDAETTLYLQPDYELAYQYAKQATSIEDNQYPEGCRIYAELIRNGHYVQKADDDIVISWYRGAAERGDYYSYSQIGYIQYYSLRNYDEAAKNLELYLASATEEEEKQNAWVFHLLGRVYGDLGTKRDPDKCLLYASKGAEYGNDWCMYTLGCYYRGGWSGTTDYELALIWFQRGVDAGNSWCMTCMGEMYENGWGVEQDYAIARDWYQKALAAGDEGAQAKLDALPQ